MARDRELPPPGWYPDPAGVAEQRYWDGTDWTDGVSRGSVVTEEPLPEEGAAAAWQQWHDTHTDQRAQWPGTAAAWAMGGWVLSVLLSVASGLAAWAAGAGDLGLIIASQAGLWTGLLFTCRFVSRRYGTGNIASDYRLAMRWRDLGWGFLVSWAARLITVAVVLPFVLIDDRFEETSDVFGDLERNAATVITIALVAIVGAPLIEELFFRGLLQRAFENVLPLPAAIAAQAALFGLAHFSVDSGWANIPTMLGVGAAGAVFGVAAYRWHRLGPSIAAHGFFNVVPVLVLIFAD